MSAFLMASVQPAEDSALLGRAHAAIRPLVQTERGLLHGLRLNGLAWLGAGYAIVLRACSAVQTIVVPHNSPDHSLNQDEFDRLVSVYVFGNEAARAISRSSAVISIALRLVPDLATILQETRSAPGICEGCNCARKPGGALDVGSAEWESVQLILRHALQKQRLSMILSSQSEELPHGK